MTARRRAPALCSTLCRFRLFPGSVRLRPARPFPACSKGRSRRRRWHRASACLSGPSACCGRRPPSISCSLPDGRYRARPSGAAILGNPGSRRWSSTTPCFTPTSPTPWRSCGTRSTQLASTGLCRPDGEDSRCPDGLAGSVADYSGLMSASQQLVAEDILDAYAFARARCLLDVGRRRGGLPMPRPSACRTCADSVRSARRWPSRPANHLKAGLGRARGAPRGSFLDGALPRVPDSHLARAHRPRPRRRPRLTLAARRARRPCPPGGMLLIAEPIAGRAGARPIVRCVFRLLPACDGQRPGRASPAELAADMLGAGRLRAAARPAAYADAPASADRRATRHTP